jgi:hypothetical protein
MCKIQMEFSSCLIIQLWCLYFLCQKDIMKYLLDIVLYFITFCETYCVLVSGVGNF